VYLQGYGPGISKVVEIKNPFAEANLQADTVWGWIDFIPVVIWVTGICIGAYFMRRKRVDLSLAALLSAIALGNLSLKPTVLPHVEAYMQGAAVAFYEQHQAKDVYLITLGFKSYAHLFYGKIKPHSNPLRYNEGWVCSDSTDLPVYLVARIPMHENYLKAYPNLKKLSMKNGFVFLAQKKNLSLKLKE
jgi:hypothetical protein